MEDYKISIILPVFKVEKYLDYAMTSIQEQTIGFENLQVIFYDDCSPDNSGKMINKYAEEYPNVIALHSSQDSGSAGTPRNRALLHATAPYIMFLDPDDLFMPDACEVLYNTIDNTLLDFASGYFICMFEDGVLSEQKLWRAQGVYTLPSQLETILDMRVGFWAKIYRKTFLLDNKVFFAEGMLGEDMVFACRALLRAKSVAYVDKPIVLYRTRDRQDKSASFSITTKLLNDLSNAYAQVAVDFLIAGRPEILDIIVRDTLDYHVRQICENSERDLIKYINLFEKWQWLFCYLQQRNVKLNYSACQELLPIVIDGDFTKAATLLNGWIKT